MTSSSIKLSSIIKTRRAIVTTNRRRNITQTYKMIRALMIFSMTQLINQIIIINLKNIKKTNITAIRMMERLN